MIGRRALVGGLLAWPLGASAAPPKFALENQWEATVTEGAVFRATVCLLGGDQRTTGDRCVEWVPKLEGAIVYGIADLSAVPFFVPRGAIRKTMREQLPKTSVLLDWKGAVYAPLLGFPKDQEMVVQVHAADGSMIARVLGAPTADRVAAVRKAAGL